MGNESFEVAGAAPGVPLGWTLSEQSSSSARAACPAGDTEGFEEGWSSCELSRFDYVAGDLDPAMFQGRTYENFEMGFSIPDLYGPVPADQEVSAVSIGATPAVIDGVSTEPLALVNGWLLRVIVNGGPAQEFILSSSDFADIGNALAAELARVINRSADGFIAVVRDTGFGITVDLRGTAYGYDSTLQLYAGDVTTALGWLVLPVPIHGANAAASWPDQHLKLLTPADITLESSGVEPFSADWWLPGDCRRGQTNEVFLAKYWDSVLEVWRYVAGQLETAPVDIFGGGTQDAEDFESLWNNDGCKTSYMPADLASSGTETFESGW